MSDQLDEKIRKRAYEIYLERNGAQGDSAEDWTRAEREIHASELKPFKDKSRQGKQKPGHPIRAVL